MSRSLDNDQIVWRETGVQWVLIGAIALLLGAIFFDGLAQMEKWWANREEYGHGYIIPLITLFLIWQKSDKLEYIDFNGAWAGFLLTLFGLFLYYTGELSSLYTIIQYGFLVTLFGVVLSLMGVRAFRVILVPLLILFFMIPLPNFLFNNLSAQLQLVSSEIGVFFIRESTGEPHKRL